MTVDLPRSKELRMRVSISAIRIVHLIALLTSVDLTCRVWPLEPKDPQRDPRKFSVYGNKTVVDGLFSCSGCCRRTALELRARSASFREARKTLFH